MSFDPNAPVADTPSGQPPFSDNPATAAPVPVDTANTSPVVDQAGNVQVNPADSTFVAEGVVAPAERPLDSNGDPLVPGTPDEQIVADRVDGPALATNTKYAAHIEEITAKLDDLITLLGQDTSDAVLSEFKHERVAGVALRMALDTLQTTRAVLGGLDLSGSGAVGVNAGVV